MHLVTTKGPKLCMDAATQNGRKPTRRRLQMSKCKFNLKFICFLAACFTINKSISLSHRQLYNASKDLHAKHDKELLATRTQKVLETANAQDGKLDTSLSTQTCERVPVQQKSLLSNVCCEDVETIVTSNASINTNLTAEVPPPSGGIELKIAILTVSDRASSNSYTSGDLSGPAVEEAIFRQINHINSKFKDDKVAISKIDKAIVPDEVEQIKTVLLDWSGKSQTKSSYDIIFTTGGTGFSSRDVTPEATTAVLDRKCDGFMSWAGIELTAVQPLATLSRATAGVCGSSIIINLPGSPAGARQVAALLFPLLLHAVRDRI